MKFSINVEKPKEIAHQKRRQLRELEFAPHDGIIAKQIPGEASAKAEEARQKIRQKYASIQDKIESSSSLQEIKESFLE